MTIRMPRGEAPIDDSRLEKILSAISSEEALEILGLASENPVPGS